MRGTGTHRDRCPCSKVRREKSLERLEGGLMALYFEVSVEWSGVGLVGLCGDVLVLRLRSACTALQSSRREYSVVLLWDHGGIMYCGECGT